VIVDVIVSITGIHEDTVAITHGQQLPIRRPNFAATHHDEFTIAIVQDCLNTGISVTKHISVADLPTAEVRVGYVLANAFKGVETTTEALNTLNPLFASPATDTTIIGICL
jgi:nitrate reductase alpha subunit